MNPLGIEFLSVFNLPPVQLVELAAGLGCRHISTGLMSQPFNPLGYPPWSLRQDAALRREMVAALRDHGVSISLGEGFSVRPNVDVAERAVELALMYELGVRRINTVGIEPDRARCLDQFARLAELAAAAGIEETTVEFGPGLSIGTLAEAVAAVRHVGRADFRLLIDTMHLVRSGSGASELAGLDPEMIGYIQLSDAPMVGQDASYLQEAMFNRRVPGTGELPLGDILAALPRGRVVGLEVPQLGLAQAGQGPEVRLRRAVEAAQSLLATAAGGAPPLRFTEYEETTPWHPPRPASR